MLPFFFLTMPEIRNLGVINPVFFKHKYTCRSIAKLLIFPQLRWLKMWWTCRLIWTVFWHGLSFYFSLLLHFTVGLTVNFSVLLWRLCTCICKKVVCYFAGPPSTLPLSTQTSSGSSTLSKKRPPPPPPGHKRTLSDPPSPLPHGPQNKGPIPWGEFWNAKQKGRGKPLWWLIYDLWFLFTWCLLSNDCSLMQRQLR